MTSNELTQPQPTDITFISDGLLQEDPTFDLKLSIRSEALKFLPTLQSAYVLASQHPVTIFNHENSQWTGHLVRLIGYETLTTATLIRFKEEKPSFPLPYFLDSPEGITPRVINQNSNIEDLALDYYERAGSVIMPDTTPPRYSAVKRTISTAHPNERSNYIFHVNRGGALDELDIFTSFLEAGKELRNNPGVVALFLPRESAIKLYTLMQEHGNFYHILTSLFSRLLSPVVTPKLTGSPDLLKRLLNDQELRKTLFCIDPRAMLQGKQASYSVISDKTTSDWINLSLVPKT